MLIYESKDALEYIPTLISEGITMYLFLKCQKFCRVSCSDRIMKVG